MSKLDETIHTVEQGLRTAPVYLESAPPVTASLSERMARHNVPGISIAVINNSEVEWAKGYGIANAENGTCMTTETRFSAASISKPVTALAVLRLVQQGVLDLDTDINQVLQQWRVPENEYTQSAKVTLRHILSHAAGLDAGFYQGYAPDEPMPTLIQLLNGEPPSNSDPVRVITTPGTRYAYSGPGYWVLQQLIIELTGSTFADAMQKLVLEPVGMNQSTFAQPNGSAVVSHAANGHNGDGAVIFDKSTRHPGQADGGLWTTPTDLARFTLTITKAYLGTANELLAQPLAQAMLTPQGGLHGLGPFLIGRGENLYFQHGGSGEGFLCEMGACPPRGQGAVLMTNGANGWPLIQEVLRSLATHYDWPHCQPVGKKSVSLELTKLSAYAGNYIVDTDPLMIDCFLEYTGQWQARDGRQIGYAVRAEGDHLMVRFPNGDEVAFYPESSDEFFALDNPTTLRFQPGSGIAKTLQIIVSNELRLDANAT